MKNVLYKISMLEPSSLIYIIAIMIYTKWLNVVTSRNYLKLQKSFELKVFNKNCCVGFDTNNSVGFNILLSSDL